MIEGQGTLHEDGDQMVLRFERRLAHPPARVWHMVTDPDGLARWFPARAHFARLAVGEQIEFRFSDEDLQRAAEAGVEDVPLVTGGVIREVEPERVFAFDWAGELLRFELEADAGGCRLVFTHRFPRDVAQAPRNATGWHMCLEHLEAALADREGPPPERQAELKAAYAEALR